MKEKKKHKSLRPPRRPKTIKGFFKEYEEAKVDEQHILFDGKKAFVNLYGFEREGDTVRVNKNPSGKGLVSVRSNKAVDRLSPDKIDSIHFWEKLNKIFPINCVAGNPNVQTIEDLEEIFELLVEDELFKIFTKYLSPEKKILEIGAGFGSMYKSFLKREWVSKDRYYFLDIINRLNFKHPNFYKGNGWDIPKQLNNMDLIISWNTFQHFSDSQRISYWLDAYDRLKSGGIMVFSCFCMDDVNHQNVEFFNHSDEEGFPLTHFFGQFTHCMLYARDCKLLNHIGFEIIDTVNFQNTSIFALRKP